MMYVRALTRMLLGTALLAATIWSPAPLIAAQVVWRALPFANAPILNPVKGFMPYAGNYRGFPHSMEFFYIPMRDVMAGPHTFKWRSLDTQLNQIATRGHQAVFRFYLDYPTKPSASRRICSGAGSWFTRTRTITT
jgi:hypothetical protein